MCSCHEIQCVHLALIIACYIHVCTAYVRVHDMLVSFMFAFPPCDSIIHCTYTCTIHRCRPNNGAALAPLPSLSPPPPLPPPLHTACPTSESSAPLTRQGACSCAGATPMLCAHSVVLCLVSYAFSLLLFVTGRLFLWQVSTRDRRTSSRYTVW